MENMNMGYNVNNEPITNKDIRRMARERLKGNWKTPILACLLAGLTSGVANGLLNAIAKDFGYLAFAVTAPISVGLMWFFLDFIRNTNPTISSIFDGFKDYVRVIAASALQGLYTVLWSLLFIIPGIIKGLAYSLTFFILKDKPDMKANEAIKLSQELMKGNKGKLFCLQLSFIGWSFLSILTLGIGFIWLVPYMQTSMAFFYESIVNSKLSINPSYSASPYTTTVDVEL